MVAPSWSIPAGPKMCVGILHHGIVSVDWAITFRQMQFPPGTPFLFTSHWPYDVARNNQAEQAFEQNHAEWLLFLDSDVLAPVDSAARLMSHGLPIVSGVYHSKAGDHHPLVLQRADQPQPDGSVKRVYSPVPSWQPGSLVPVDTVATGLLLIHRRVYEAFKKAHGRWQGPMVVPDPQGDLDSVPLFQWTYGRAGDSGVEGLSEDFAFGLIAQRLGFPMYADTALLAGHVTTGIITGPGPIRQTGVP